MTHSDVASILYLDHKSGPTARVHERYYADSNPPPPALVDVEDDDDDLFTIDAAPSAPPGAPLPPRTAAASSSAAASSAAASSADAPHPSGQLPHCSISWPPIFHEQVCAPPYLRETK